MYYINSPPEAKLHLEVKLNASHKYEVLHIAIYVYIYLCDCSLLKA